MAKLSFQSRHFRFTHGLRFRLAAAFLLFFTLVLIALGFLIRQVLLNVATNQTYALLDEEWATSKGYLRVEQQAPQWYYDRYDPEEAIIVNRIQGGVYLFADISANIVERSTPARSLGIDTREEVRDLIERARKGPQQSATEIRTNEHGVPYLLRFGLIPDEKQRLYLFVIGRSLADRMGTVNQFTLQYFIIVPLVIVLCGALGWLVAGRALVPVTEVAQAAHRITGSNLSVRIPPRGADDELDRLINAFNRMIERLNHSFEQIRQFSTDVSHELRTPLTAIRGQLEVALFTAEKPEQFRDAMVNALQDVEQLSNIVRALLLLSQAESGQLTLQLSPVNLKDVVLDIVDQFQIPAEESQITITAGVREDVIVSADRTQMDRLLSNLLSNSIKYTKPGGRVQAGVRQEDNRAVLWVEDNGIGIPAEKLPHIFDRFYRVRPSQSNPVQGLGLGLSFVSWIVNAHGGKIHVDSKEGQGTRFTISFPLATAGAPPHRSELPGAVLR